MPPGGPGMFTEQPTDRELYWYGLLEVPSYGGVCPNCGPGSHPNGYPPSILDFDMGAKGPSPMITPVPVQELPPLHEQFSPVAPGTAPAPPAPSMHPAAQIMSPPRGMRDPVSAAPFSPMPGSAAAASMSVGPAPQGPPSMAPMQAPPSATQQSNGPAAAPNAPNGSASTWFYNRSVRQVSAQSPAATPSGATQAYYSTAAPASSSSAASPTPPLSSVRNGLYEPQSGLYVPAGAGGP